MAYNTRKEKIRKNKALYQTPKPDFILSMALCEMYMMRRPNTTKGYGGGIGCERYIQTHWQAKTKSTKRRKRKGYPTGRLVNHEKNTIMKCRAIKHMAKRRPITPGIKTRWGTGPRSSRRGPALGVKSAMVNEENKSAPPGNGGERTF